MAKGDGDKRKVSTDALDTLGTIITPNEKRDAIHLAVEPVQAKEDLSPGQWVSADGKLATLRTGVGIVDPFIPSKVKAGEWFWLVVRPREIHSLRHVWTHPAFPDTSDVAEKIGEAANVSPISKSELLRKASEDYLRDLCSTWEGPDYDALIAIATKGRWSREEDNDDDYYSGYIDSEYLHLSGQDAHGDIPQEVWGHIEIVTGLKCVYRPQYFSCSC